MLFRSVWLIVKQRMADNGWMYSGRSSLLDRTPEWVGKTNFLVNELARGSKSGIRPSCPCARCKLRQRQGKDEMSKHLWSYGYMPNYVTTVDFDEYERENGRVMRQRINGNEDDGIKNFSARCHLASTSQKARARQHPFML